MSRVRVHIDRLVVTGPSFDEAAFIAAIEQGVEAEWISSGLTDRVGTVRARRAPSSDGESVGSAVADAIRRSLG